MQESEFTGCVNKVQGKADDNGENSESPRNSQHFEKTSGRSR
jgi:hypothetical protein